MKFDHALDVEKLKGALEQVLGRPGWRRLGARLRLNASPFSQVENLVTTNTT